MPRSLTFFLRAINAWLCLSNTVFATPLQIRFAMDATYPPFETMTPKGEITGFDVAVAKAICNTMQASCTFSSQPFDSLLPSLALGKYDALISAINVTPARAQRVDFSVPYYINTGSFVATTKTSFAIIPEQLKNKRIGVQQGSTFAEYMRKKYGEIVTIKTYANDQEAFIDLSANRIDAVLGDTPVVALWLKNHPGEYHFLGAPIHDPSFFGDGYAIAVKKGRTDLLEALNKGILTIRADGTLKKLAHDYFGPTP